VARKHLVHEIPLEQRLEPKTRMVVSGKQNEKVLGQPGKKKKEGGERKASNRMFKAKGAKADLNP